MSEPLMVPNDLPPQPPQPKNSKLYAVGSTIWGFVSTYWYVFALIALAFFFRKPLMRLAA